MLWKWLKKIKDLYSWYSFGSTILGKVIPLGVVSSVGVFVVGVPAAIAKRVPWPITLMAGFFVLVAVAGLAASPLIIRTITPNKTQQPIRPHWDAWKHVEKFTVREAACLLENLEPLAYQNSPKIEARIVALCAAIRKGDLEFIKEKQGSDFGYDQEDRRAWRQQREPSGKTEITKTALLDFAKRNNIDLKYLGQ